MRIGEEEQSDARRRSRRGRGDAVVLLEHVVEVLIGSDGDEGIQLLVRELVLEVKRPAVVEHAREVGDEGRE